MMPPAEFSSIVPEVGFLPDHRIRAALTHGYLLEPGTWRPEQIRHASYTLRLGSRVEIDRGRDSQREHRERVSLALTSGGRPLDLQPGDTALLYSLENLRLPACVLGFTVARGLLFVESLVPENTYVDPGFTGSIYTTVTNLSERVVQLEYGMPIARLFFYRLAADVEQPYQSGPAIGIPQHLPSRPSSKFPTVHSARAAKTADLLDDLEASERGWPRTRELVTRQTRLARVALFTAIAWPLLLQIAASWTWLHANFGSFIASVLASVVAVPVIWFSERLWARFWEN